MSKATRPDDDDEVDAVNLVGGLVHTLSSDGAQAGVFIVPVEELEWSREATAAGLSKADIAKALCELQKMGVVTLSFGDPLADGSRPIYDAFWRGF